jgi:hypothetical protein
VGFNKIDAVNISRSTRSAAIYIRLEKVEFALLCDWTGVLKHRSFLLRT